GGLRHDQVVIRVLVGNGVLAAAAWVAAAGAPGIGAAIAVGMVGALLLHFRRRHPSFAGE
ncbi:MAG: hypothetical protein WCZ23_14740, partial [Rhodospirillaceae bacterium]